MIIFPWQWSIMGFCRIDGLLFSFVLRSGPAHVGDIPGYPGSQTSRPEDVLARLLRLPDWHARHDGVTRLGGGANTWRGRIDSRCGDDVGSSNGTPKFHAALSLSPNFDRYVRGQFAVCLFDKPMVFHRSPYQEWEISSRTCQRTLATYRERSLRHSSCTICIYIHRSMHAHD